MTHNLYIFMSGKKVASVCFGVWDHVPVSLRVVQRYSTFSSAQSQRRPSDDPAAVEPPRTRQDPDDGAHGHRRAPEHLLLWKQTQLISRLQTQRKPGLKNAFKNITVRFYVWQMFPLYSLVQYWWYLSPSNGQRGKLMAARDRHHSLKRMNHDSPPTRMANIFQRSEKHKHTGVWIFIHTHVSSFILKLCLAVVFLRNCPCVQ